MENEVWLGSRTPLAPQVFVKAASGLDPHLKETKGFQFFITCKEEMGTNKLRRGFPFIFDQQMMFSPSRNPKWW